jgi:hypothetical protein
VSWLFDVRFLLLQLMIAPENSFWPPSESRKCPSSGAWDSTTATMLQKQICQSQMCRSSSSNPVRHSTDPTRPRSTCRRSHRTVPVTTRQSFPSFCPSQAETSPNRRQWIMFWDTPAVTMSVLGRSSLRIANGASQKVGNSRHLCSQPINKF